MDKYTDFQSFELEEWIRWLEDVLQDEVPTPNFGHSEVLSNFYDAYNYLVRNKLSTKYFKQALSSIIRSVPISENYSMELYFLINFSATVKPSMSYAYFRSLLVQESLKKITYETKSLHHVLINTICSCQDDKTINEYFKNKIYNLEEPSFYILPIRYFYKWSNKIEPLFNYIIQLWRVIEDSEFNSQYVYVLVHGLAEMTIVLKNFNDVYAWWIENSDLLKDEYPICYKNFIIHIEAWLGGSQIDDISSHYEYILYFVFGNLSKRFLNHKMTGTESLEINHSLLKRYLSSLSHLENATSTEVEYHVNTLSEFISKNVFLHEEIYSYALFLSKRYKNLIARDAFEAATIKLLGRKDMSAKLIKDICGHFVIKNYMYGGT